MGLKNLKKVFSDPKKMAMALMVSGGIVFTTSLTYGMTNGIEYIKAKRDYEKLLSTSINSYAYSEVLENEQKKIYDDYKNGRLTAVEFQERMNECQSGEIAYTHRDKLLSDKMVSRWESDKEVIDKYNQGVQPHKKMCAGLLASSIGYLAGGYFYSKHLKEETAYLESLYDFKYPDQEENLLEQER
ncbi:MAG: hypothetical protein IJW59_03380 [Clostridia bacterium]|nr:hypothetical protein [Clostridia bacterium]